ncbi:MAG: hypothetical protein IJ346_06920 [Clostridia bacterium]|nr:hypothetical protein [Clostridia bacterium]
MGKFFIILGFLIFVFILITNYTSIELSDPVAIALGIASATSMITGVLINNKGKKKR